MAVEKSKASYSQTGLTDAAGMTSTYDMLKQFDEELRSSTIDLSKTFDDRFAKKAAAGG